MSIFKNIINYREHHLWWLHYLSAIFFVVVVIFLFLPFFLQLIWADKIYPNVHLGQLELGRQNLNAAHGLLQEKIDDLEISGYEFATGNNRVVIFPLITAPGDPDFTYELVIFDTERMYTEVMLVGRIGSKAERWLAVYRALLKDTMIPVHYELNGEALVEILQSNFINEETPVRNASFAYEAGELKVVPDKIGRVIFYDQAVADLNIQLRQLTNEPVSLNLISERPTIEYKAVASLQPQAKEFLQRTPIKLSAKYNSDRLKIGWEKNIDKTTAATWLAPVVGDNGIELGFGEGLIAYLDEQSIDINHEPLDAKFEINDGRITQFQASQEGVTVDISASVDFLQSSLLRDNEEEVELVLTVEAPKVTTSEVNDLGINEIIGIGKSNFSGSPANRRINIKVSSDKLNGLLVAPGEEFSLVAALKPFTREAGYLPELVIKGNRLIPEVGGGACQIGTTTFRTVLDAGLEITQRRNHSFAVSYYNDENGLPGTDATIYDPAPDFRFINNTPGHILIQTHVGDDSILTYEFWGTNDGRQASTTIPVILSRSPAPDTKYIETEDLEPGVTDCTGSNVPGYSTTFKYSIALSNGEYSEEYFNSKYRPWQRVCLIGIEKAESEEESEEGLIL